MAQEQEAPPDAPSDGPSGESAEDRWYRTEILAHPEKFDDAIPKDVWVSWYGLWNPRTKKFGSIKLDEGGNAIAGEFDKPTDCPDGTTAYGQNQCLRLDHPKVLGVRPGAAPAPAAAPDATAGGPGDIAYTGNPLVDMLIYQFNMRRSLAKGDDPNIFGMAKGRTGGVPGRDIFGQPTGLPDVTGKLLKGGGLMWSEVAPGTPVAPPVAPSPAPGAAPVSATTPAVPDVTGGSVTPPVVGVSSPAPAQIPSLTPDSETPLQKMLRKRMPVADAPKFDLGNPFAGL